MLALKINIINQRVLLLSYYYVSTCGGLFEVSTVGLGNGGGFI